MAFQGASSSSSFTRQWAYDVFLSFRGEDTGTNFTAHLYSALRQNGITTFIHDELTSGEEISPTHLKAIEESKISIIIFSQNYASSAWCLDELMKILECEKTKGQEVLPVFYNVDKLEVQNQTFSVGKAFTQLEDKFKDDKMKIQMWKKALTEAAQFPGKPLELGKRIETEFIREIIGWVNPILLEQTQFQVARHPVGIESRVQAVKLLLDIEKNDCTCMVGIFGTGGVGKTTLVQAIYNSIASQFQRSCYLGDIRETSGRKEGLIYLQNELLAMILRGSSLKVENVHQGITLIKESLHNLRVLLVLDDVDNLVQLKYLVGKGNWFGLGSRIIIATRNKFVLRAHGVGSIYQVKELDHNEALQLFSWHAFNRDKPHDHYVEVTTDVIRYSGGLPLALTLLGSTLKGRDARFWKSKLEAYKRIPPNDILENLRISYDGLNANAKDIFLHIACFFKGENAEYVTKILDSVGFCSYTGIEDLKDNCLITQSHGSLVMHDLVQEVGREIVRQESPNKPGKRSRLWFHEDVRYVLEQNMGTEIVEAILVDLPEADLIHLSSEVFKKMNRLKLFICRNARFSEELNFLPNELRFLYWPKYPEESFPSNFHGKQLAILRMPHSNLKGLEGVELVDLSLVNCYNLRSFPRSLKLRSLESFVLRGCLRLKNFPEIECQMTHLEHIDFQYTSIEKLPSSIGYLIGVKKLYLAGCTNLTSLPDSIYQLQNLEYLNLNGCTSIERLPSSIGYLVRIKTLDLGGCTNLMNLPNSIYQLQHLQQLDLQGCSKVVKFPNNRQSIPSIASTKEFEISSAVESVQPFLVSNDGCSSISFPKLQWLDLGNCALSESNFFTTFDCCSMLNHLDLSGSDIVTIPRCIESFVGLTFLYLNECKQLREIIGLPPNVEVVKARECMSLEIFLEGRRSQLFNTWDPPKPMGRGRLFPTLQSSSLVNSVVTESKDCFFSLEELDLSSSAIVSLPTWFNKFVELKCLTLKDCKQLREISKLPSKIEEVDAHGCTSLERFQSNNIYDLPALQWIDLSDCHKMCENIGNDVQFRLLNKGYPEDYKFVCIFPGDKIPDWFSHSKEVSNSNSCEIPINGLAHLDGDITRIALCVVIGTKANIPDGQDEIIKGGQDEDAYGIIFKVINGGEEIYSYVKEDIPGQFHSDHV
ncbi:disease resistance protein RPV1-like [Corylus avellana]|uniref:disease resistance protein RPV1-like n=1 Tax=Corylus avellana TaxID=13451 RepID=UPI00286CAA97|nr:disease resistance protein RPV1-like [Corylus avellana]